MGFLRVPQGNLFGVVLVVIKGFSVLLDSIAEPVGLKVLVAVEVVLERSIGP